MKKVLITGGAGFIGSHLAQDLIEKNYHVKVLDNLSPQVHGNITKPPAYLHPDVEFIKGDVRNAEVVEKSLQQVDAVFHFAAMVGVGQSMYEVENYTSVNNCGTAVLMEILMKRPVEKLVVASSMSIYGEGLYQNQAGETVVAYRRNREQLREGIWELYDKNGEELKPIATPENKQPDLSSVYALSKYDQERLCLMLGEAYDIPTTALRFFNAYGPHQALSNPYTGVLAIFASRYLNDNPPLIFEDGNQMRDFVHVKDVALACRLAMESDRASGQVLNVGSGNNYTIREIAEKIQVALNKTHINSEISGKYRVGDIRHCFADINKTEEVIGFRPQVDIESGIVNLAEWLETQVADDKVSSMKKELEKRGLTL